MLADANNEAAELRKLLAESSQRLMAAKEQLEFDRTKCAEFVTALDKAIDGRFWLTEGRGSYTWDDDRYRDEFRDAAKELLAAVAPIRSMAINMAARLESTDQVIQARRDIKAENITLRFAMRQAIKNAGGIADPGVSDEFLIWVVPAEMGALKHKADKLERELAAREEQIDHLFRHSGRQGSEDYDAVEVSAAWARLRQPVGGR
jgi:hypothetical protein